jgi:large subunit ribosomal protein L18
MLKKQEKKIRRHKKVRARVSGTMNVPRLCVFRSNQHIYAQAIDDEKGVTIIAAHEKEIKKTDAGDRKGKTALAYGIGKLIAEKALEKKIKKIVFDRGGYKYHGRVKALAEGAREGGLEF